MNNLLTAITAASPPSGGAATGEVIGATLGAGALSTILFVLGVLHHSGRVAVFEKPAQLAARVSGLPKWVALPSAFSTGSLLVALLGMYWDISLHIDNGRDPGPLANPAHYLILLGLFGIFASGWLSMVMAPKTPGPTSVRIYKDWNAPLGGAILLACGGFALIGFPLDDMWHRLFGQDVTLWGPTHLMLIGGAGMTLIGQAVLLVEGSRDRAQHRDATGAEAARPRKRLGGMETYVRRGAVCGGLLIGLSTFQGEFDFGVPQFQLIFHPLLIALAAGIALTAARIWAGPGGALFAAGFFLVVRGGISLIVAGIFGETLPHFPIYFAEAGLVELVALAFVPRDRPLTFGLAAGLAVGTVGTAIEWAWTHAVFTIPWNSSLFPEALILAPLTGLAAGTLGVWVGAALHTRPTETGRNPGRPVAIAAATIVAIVGFGLITSPRQGVSADVTLTTAKAGADREVNALIKLNPPDAAKDAHWLNVTAWQGSDKLVVDDLKKVGNGVYRTTEPIPVHNDWKALLRLSTGNSLDAIPLYLPNDPAIPAKEVPASAHFQRTFIADKKILQREAKSSSSVVKTGAYGVVLAIALSLLGFLGWSLRRLAREGSPPRRPRPGRASKRPVSPTPA